jgi:hypothetical protein
MRGACVERVLEGRSREHIAGRAQKNRLVGETAIGFPYYLNHCCGNWFPKISLNRYWQGDLEEGMERLSKSNGLQWTP